MIKFTLDGRNYEIESMQDFSLWVHYESKHKKRENYIKAEVRPVGYEAHHVFELRNEDSIQIDDKKFDLPYICEHFDLIKSKILHNLELKCLDNLA